MFSSLLCPSDLRSSENAERRRGGGKGKQKQKRCGAGGSEVLPAVSVWGIIFIFHGVGERKKHGTCMGGFKQYGT